MADRVGARLLALEVETGDAEAQHFPLLPRRQLAVQPDECPVQAHALGEVRRIGIRQHGRELARRLVRIDHAARVGVERGRREAGGEYDAVAVEDVRPLGFDALAHDGAVHARLLRRAEHGQVDEAQPDAGEGGRDHRAGDEKARPPGFERFARGTIGRQHLRRHAGPPARRVRMSAAVSAAERPKHSDHRCDPSHGFSM